MRALLSAFAFLMLRQNNLHLLGFFFFFFNQKKTRMDQTLTVWETQPTHDAVHLKMGKQTVSCLSCDFCDYLLFYLLDQKNIGVFENVEDCNGRKWKSSAILLLADHCNRSTHYKVVFKDIRFCYRSYNSVGMFFIFSTRR